MKWKPGLHSSFTQLGLCLAVPTTRVIAFWCLYWGPVFLDAPWLEALEGQVVHVPQIMAQVDPTNAAICMSA